MSDDIAIRVENLSKRYLIRHQRAAGDGLRHVLQDKLTAPFRKLFRKDTPRPLENGNQPSTNNNQQSVEEFWALRDVSFEVKRGEVVGIIGRNGAGKSTLLKILSRITEPTSGRVSIQGRVASLLEVGTGFHPELSGRENIYLNGAMLGMTRAEIRKRFDEIVAFAGTEKFLDTPVKRYSSGMYVRLAFAVAAHLDPEILIVDEVLAVGDVQFQRKCQGKMNEVATRQGRTVLVVSHNMSAIRNLCLRAAFLEKGQIKAVGAVEDVITQYVSSNAVELISTIDLPPPREIESGAYATKLHLLNREGMPQTQFRIGEPWTVRLDFELTHNLPHVIAGVGLLNLEAIPLVTWWSKPSDLCIGRYTVEFECDLPFSAGQLNFAVGITSNEQSVYYIEGIGLMTISEIALGEQPLRASGCGILASTMRPLIFARE